MSKKEKIQCVILAGGKGSRLDGRGKFSEKLFNKTLLEHVVTRISKQTSEIAINFHNKKPFIDFNLHIVLDKFKEDIGPLAGIHAALKYAQECDSNNKSVVTVPIDTPFMPLNLLDKLNNQLNKKLADVVIASSGGRFHPTIAIWNVSIIKKLESSIEKNIRKIDIFTNELKKSYVDWDVKKYDPFFNINNYNDLKIAENMIKKNIIE